MSNIKTGAELIAAELDRLIADESDLLILKNKV